MHAGRQTDDPCVAWAITLRTRSDRAGSANKRLQIKAHNGYNEHREGTYSECRFYERQLKKSGGSKSGGQKSLGRLPESLRTAYTASPFRGAPCLGTFSAVSENEGQYVARVPPVDHTDTETGRASFSARPPFRTRMRISDAGAIPARTPAHPCPGARRQPATGTTQLRAAKSHRDMPSRCAAKLATSRP